MNGIDWALIDLKAVEIGNGYPTDDDLKDAIVEYYMHDIHFTDEELEYKVLEFKEFELNEKL